MVKRFGEGGCAGRQCPGECGVSPGGPPVFARDSGTVPRDSDLFDWESRGSTLCALLWSRKEVLLPSQPFSLHSRHIKKQCSKEGLGILCNQ